MILGAVFWLAMVVTSKKVYVEIEKGTPPTYFLFLHRIVTACTGGFVICVSMMLWLLTKKIFGY